jgi:hypothetical protein
MIDGYLPLGGRTQPFLRTGPSKAVYPSPDQRTSLWGANAPLPFFGFCTSDTSTPPPVFGLPFVKGGGCDPNFSAWPLWLHRIHAFEGLIQMKSVNRDFLMVFEIKEISLLSKVCFLGALTAIFHYRWPFCRNEGSVSQEHTFTAKKFTETLYWRVSFWLKLGLKH